MLSKTLGIMLLPANLMIGVGLVGAVLLATRFVSLGRKLLVASVVLLAICGYSPLGIWLLYPLEARFPAWDAARGAPDGIVVLGGAIDPDLSAAHDIPVHELTPRHASLEEAYLDITKDSVEYHITRRGA